MALTEIQNKIYRQILLNIKATKSSQIVYVSEWLGWFPYGAYHWINDCDGKDITRDFPSGWERLDIDALERKGLLKKISEWQNPNDNFDIKITYDVILSEI